MNRAIYPIVGLNHTLFICREKHVSIINSNGFFYGQNSMKYASPLLMLQLIVISFVSRATYFCLRPLGQSFEFSQMLAGVILGPSCLSHEKVFAKKLFPDSSRNSLETIASFGLMFFFFEMGVKTDTSAIKQCGSKSIAIGLSVFFIPLFFSISLSIILTHFVGMEQNLLQSLPLVAGSQALTGFIAVGCLLTERRIHNTDLGRLAVSVSMIGDTLGISLVAIALPLMQSKVHMIPTTLGWLTTVLMVVFIVYVLRPVTQWMIRQTPEGETMNEHYIFAVLVGILVVGYVSEIVGQHFIFGPLVFGLSVPDGPPLGSALVEKLDCICNLILFPTYVAVSGLKTNIFSITFRSTWILALVISVIFFVKIFATMLPCLYCNLPVLESFVLAIMINVKGIPELVLYNIWKDVKVLDVQTFTLTVLSMLVITAFVAPTVRFLYDPSKRYISCKKCTIQHAKRDAELRILVCIKKQQSVPTVINLIEQSHATDYSPISVFVLQLTELIGRSTPILIYHQPECTISNANTTTGHIINAFRNYEARNKDIIHVYSYTAIAHLATMHHDVINLAIDKMVNIVIVPFHKEWAIDGEVELENRGIRSMNSQILNNAPCSVGILVDRRILSGSVSVQTSQSFYRVGLFYMGGNDDGEVLAYASRMVEHHTVALTVIRFLAFGGDNARERKLDNDTIDEFKLKHADNHRIQYLEKVVKDGEGFASVIKGMGEFFDLLLVGRHQRKDSRFLTGLDEWSECPELGVVGDMLASPDMKGMCSVLIVQQAKQQARFISTKETDGLIHDVPNVDNEVRGAAWTIAIERL